MRLYLKLLLMIVVFAGASNSQLQETTSDLAYDARVAFVCRFGSAADYEALVDDTQHMLASEQGNLDLHLKGKRYRQLLAERRAAAARRGASLTDDDLAHIAAEAFGPLRWSPAAHVEAPRAALPPLGISEVAMPQDEQFPSVSPG